MRTTKPPHPRAHHKRTVSLPADLSAKLDEAVLQYDTTRSAILKEALVDWFRKVERRRKE